MDKIVAQGFSVLYKSSTSKGFLAIEVFAVAFLRTCNAGSHIS